MQTDAEARGNREHGSGRSRLYNYCKPIGKTLVRVVNFCSMAELSSRTQAADPDLCSNDDFCGDKKTILIILGCLISHKASAFLKPTLASEHI